MEIRFTEEDSIKIVQELLERSGITTTRTTDQYCHYDLENVTDDIRVEVKCRTMSYRDLLFYSETKDGMILEHIKYRALIGHKNSYVNLYDTDKGIFIVGWDINKHKSEVGYHKCAENTSFGGYYNKVDKPVHYLKISKADNIFEYKGEGQYVKLTVEQILNR